MSASPGLSPPPPQTRHRPSCTNLRSAFTLNSLGRRRSNSCLNVEAPLDSPLPVPPPLAIDPISTAPPPPPSMLVIFASRFLEWLHLQPKHNLSWSTPSSPRSSADEFVLPLSASAQKTSFGDDVHQDLAKSQLSQGWRLSVCSFHSPS